MEPVVGVCRTPWSGTLQDKTERAQDTEEAIASWNPAIGIYPAYHEPQLVSSYARIHFAYMPDCVYYRRQAVYMALFIASSLVIGLPCAAK